MATQKQEQDRINQLTAQLSLRKIPNEYPVFINTNAKVDSRLDNYQKKKIGNLIKMTGEPVLDPSVFIDNSMPEELQDNSLGSGFRNSSFFLQDSIAQQTQGQVFQVEILPATESIFSSKLNPSSQTEKEIPAILKKSPIIDPKTWKYYQLLQVIKTLQSTKEGQDYLKIDANKNNIKELLTNLHATQREIPTISEINSLIEQYSDLIQKQWNNKENDAYIDSFGYYLGSSLVEDGVSPFFPLLYATFQSYDSDYFSQEENEKYFGFLNDKFPVQVIIQQKLGDSVEVLIKKDEYNKKGRIESMVAQIILGVLSGQNAFDLVNNDLHLNNVLSEDVDPNSFIYYKFYDPNRSKIIYYQVPTNGKIYKMIDLGHSHYCLKEKEKKCFTANINSFFPQGYDPQSKSADITRFLWELGVKLHSLDKFDQINPLGGMFSKVMECANGVDIFVKYFECFDEEGEEDEQCTRNIRFIYPFMKDSGCNNGNPISLLPFLSKYEIPFQRIPKDAIVYAIG